MGNFPIPWTARTSEKVTSDWQAKQCPLLGYHAIVVSFVVVSVQWNLVIAKGQVFVISSFFSHILLLSGQRKSFRYIEVSLYQVIVK